MTRTSLTASWRGATSQAMQRLSNSCGVAVRRGWVLLPITLLGGCISVEAPDGPIVIELNINIRSEVIYQLAEDTAETIEENADIF
ncbi:YnbE family lipoprotein [Altererythrobacter sp.]|uniref:YnbE family lipoprotein n=1 Tax=Altererythrobacter sp. TaxID=1872480 RepID=UPI00257F9CCD|nr:YnbE family lipoprotein [Altererythrobacter sp.]